MIVGGTEQEVTSIGREGLKGSKKKKTRGSSYPRHRGFSFDERREVRRISEAKPESTRTSAKM